MGNCCACCQSDAPGEREPLLPDKNGISNHNHTQPIDASTEGHLTASYVSRQPSGQNSPNSSPRYSVEDIRLRRTIELVKNLKYVFGKSVLPHVTWLKKKEDLPIKHYYVAPQLTGSGNTVLIEELFASDAKRVLLEGKAGHGKTSLCFKILYDWAKEADYTKKFKFVFIIPLRNLISIEGVDLIEAIAKFYSIIYDEEFRTIIEENAEETLYIFDGLDEIADDIELIKEKLKVNDKSTLFVTCRNEFLASQNPENTPTPLYDRNHYGKQFVISGVGNDKHKELLDKFFSSTVTEMVIGNLEQDPLLISMKELFQCPLYLYLLAFVVNQNQNPQPKTKTDLFKQFINCAIKLSIDSDNDEFDIFDEKSVSASGFSEFVRGFCRAMLENLPKKKLLVENNKFTHEMHRLGLMTRHNEIYLLKERTFYQLFDETLLEFFVALRLQTEHKANNFTFYSGFADMINNLVIEKGNSTLIVQFLIGLMNNTVKNFFEQMEPFAHLYSSQETVLWNIMQEVQLQDEGMEILAKFLPGEIHQSPDSSLAPFYRSSNHEKLIRLGVTNGKIKCIHYIFDAEIKLPSDTPIPLLQIDIPKGSNEALENMNCEYLFCKCRETDDKEEADKIFKLCTSIPAEKRAFEFTKSDYFVNKSGLQNIDYFIYEFKSEDSTAASIISTLAEENQIEKLHLKISAASSIENVRDIVKHISNLKTFVLENKTKEVCEFDLQQFASSDDTREKNLILRNVKILPTEKHLYLNLLDLDDSNPEAATTLTSVTPVFLKCTTRLMYALHKIEPHKWAGYQSVKELILQIDENALKPQVWSNLSSFQSLDSLAIYLLQKSSRQYWGIDEIHSNILSLPVRNFVIWSVQFNLQSVAALCVKMKEYMLEKNECNFQNVTLYFGKISEDEKDDVRSIVNDLLQCLNAGKLKTVGICCSDLSLWVGTLQQVVDMKLFAVEHDIYGTKDTDPNVSKIHCNELLYVCNRFSITVI